MAAVTALYKQVYENMQKKRSNQRTPISSQSLQSPLSPCTRMSLDNHDNFQSGTPTAFQ